MRNDEYVNKTKLQLIRKEKKELRKMILLDLTKQYPDFWQRLDKLLPSLSYSKKLILADLLYQTMLNNKD